MKLDLKKKMEKPLDILSGIVMACILLGLGGFLGLAAWALLPAK